MANMITPEKVKRNHNLSREIRLMQAGKLDTEIYKKLNPSRRGSANRTAFDAGFRYAESGYCLEDLTKLQLDYISLIEGDLIEDDCHHFLEQLLYRFQYIIDFDINYPTLEKPSESLKRFMKKLRSFVDFNIDNPTEEEMRISKFIDGYNKFFRKAEIDFDLGYESAKKGIKWDDIVGENKKSLFFQDGFRTYFTEIGFDYGLLETDLEYISIELKNNQFFMYGYNAGVIEGLMNKSTNRKVRR